MRVSRTQRRLAQKPGKVGSWDAFRKREIEPHFRQMFPACARCEAFFVNSIYSVQMYRFGTSTGEVTHLVVRRHDMKPIRSWEDMQRIKDELVGPERVAVEVYPPRSQLIDEAELYHLWVLPEDYALPFGLHMPDGGM
jgi:hypothetical protein